jgi:thiol-disulfide isomerase/thioredoxin
MIERILVTLILIATGVAAYRLFTHRHLHRAIINAASDPVLRGLKPGVPTIVYFTTPTCIPCKTQQQPALSRLQSELGEMIQIIKIDATEDTAAADRWGVISAPTTFILDSNGQPREVNYGVADADKLKRQIQAVTAA